MSKNPQISLEKTRPGLEDTPSIAHDLGECLSETNNRKKILLSAEGINDIYGAGIALYNSLSEKTEDTMRQQYFQEKSSLYSFNKLQNSEITRQINVASEQIQILAEKGFLSKEEDLEYQSKIIKIKTHLSEIKKEYISLFNTKMCGSNNDKKEVYEFHRDIVFPEFTKTTIEIMKIEEEAYEKALKSYVEKPDLNFSVLSSYMGKHVNGVKSGLSTFLILSQEKKIQTYEVENGRPTESETGYFNEDNFIISEKAMKKTHDEIVLAIKKGGKASEKIFLMFEKLEDPSVFSFQGLLQVAENKINKAENKIFPPFVINILKSIKGEESQKEVTQYFIEFQNNPALKNYKKKMQIMKNPNSDIFKWIQNPTPENTQKIEDFMDDFENKEYHFLESMGVLVSNLEKKGAGHKELMDMVTWVKDHLVHISTVGVAAGIGTGAIIWKTLKSIEKRMKGLGKSLPALSILFDYEKLLKQSNQQLYGNTSEVL